MEISTKFELNVDLKQIAYTPMHQLAYKTYFVFFTLAVVSYNMCDIRTVVFAYCAVHVVYK